MSDFLRVGTRQTVSGAAEVAIDLDLESETAVGISIDEDVGSTVASFRIRNNAQTSIFSIHATGDTENFFDLTSVVTTGDALTIAANSVTTGSVINVNSTATAITTSGRLLEVIHTGTTSTSGTLVEFKTAAADETNLLELDAVDLTTGIIQKVVGTALTSGKGIELDAFDGLTSGVMLDLESGATAITGAGRMLYVDHSGTTSTSGILSEFTSANTDETVVLRVTSSAASTGTVLDLSAASLTTGTVLDVGDLDGLTTGTGVQVESNGADTGTRNLVNILNDNALATGVTCLNIKQDALLEAMSIDMGTLDKGFINFKATADADATSAISTFNTTGTVSDFIQIGLNGASAWIAVSTADPTS